MLAQILLATVLFVTFRIEIFLNQCYVSYMNYVTLIASMNAYLNVTETLATVNYFRVNQPLMVIQ